MTLRAATRLVALWRERIHPAAGREQVAIAFTLLSGGLVLGCLGVLVAIGGDLLFARPSWMREAGIAAAASGLPLFLLGLAAALPGKPWLRALTAAGAASCAAGIALFIAWYPDRWHVTVQAPNGFAVGAYLFGAALLSGTAAAAIGDYFVQRASRARPGQGGWDQDRPVTDAEVEADLAWASKQGWSWGGIRQGAPATRIVLKDSAEPMVLRGRGQPVRLLGTPSAAPDIAAAAALTGLRGTAKRTATDTVVDAQVGSLKELRARAAAKEAARRSTWWWRLLHPFHH